MKECNQCGKCCVNYGGSGGLSASPDDVLNWEIFRPDIAQYVSEGEIWIDPISGKPLSQCPWLQQTSDSKYACGIYDDRPEDCRHYPTSIAEMVRDECEMIELKDIANTKKAQKILDDMMVDSRPPYLGRL